MKKNDHIFKVLRVPGFFFSPQFCDVAEVVVIHFGDLARFGYMLDMKAEKKQNPSIFLATYWNSSLKSGDLDFLFFGNLVNLGHFLHAKSFVYVKVIFFRSQFVEISRGFFKILK